MITDSGNQYGGWSALRPLMINLASGKVSMRNGLDMGNQRLTAVGTPTANTDAANKAYVDSAVTTYTGGTGITVSGSTVSLDSNQQRRPSTATAAGVVAYNGNTPAQNYFYGGTTDPTYTAGRINFGGSLYASNFYSSAYYYFSDRNLKKDIETIGADEGMEIVRDLRPVSYAWRSNDRKALGVIAQEIEEVMPTAVSTNETGVKAVDYIQIIAPMLGGDPGAG